MGKLEVIDETPRITDAEKRGITKQTKTYKLNGEKFQIRYENSNGSPLGFNSKMCLAQYSKAEGRWNKLEDIKVLDINPAPSYFSHQCVAHMDQFFELMEQRLEKIYS